MTNDPADAPRDERTDPSLAPPSPPPGPLWPDAGAASANGWPSLGDAVPTPPSAKGPAPERATATAAAPGSPDAGPATGTGPGTPFGTHLGAHLNAAFAPGFMSRYGLVRPLAGRHFAGVCAAVGRATNTDPVLWRVLFAVLTLFGGVGLLAYLVGWLLIPGEGDTASPVEAAFGRGVSRTSVPVAVIGTVTAILVFALVASEGLRPAVVGALVVLGAAVLLSKGGLRLGQQSGPAPAATPMPGPPDAAAAPYTGPPTPPATTPHPVPPPAVPPVVVPPPVATDPAAGPAGFPASGPTASPVSGPTASGHAPAHAPAHAVAAGSRSTVDVPVDRPDPAGPAGAATGPDLTERDPSGPDPTTGHPTLDAPAGPVDPDRRAEAAAGPAYGVTSESPTWPLPPTAARPGGPYRQPFAPHGPFAPPGPYPPAFRPTGQFPAYPPVPGQPMLPYPGLPHSGPPHPGPLSAPPGPKVKRPKSRLFRVTLSAMVIALGTLGVVNFAGLSIVGSAYFAVALAVVGLGLLAGAWVGRSRLLIPLGFALSIGLLGSTVEGSTSSTGFDGGPHAEPFTPSVVAEITANSPFRIETGSLFANFQQVDFTGQEVRFDASVELGSLRLVLPPNVDVEIRARVEVGDATVLGDHWGGLSDRWRTVIDEGPDGPGGGKLMMELTVETGNLEVTR